MKRTAWLVFGILALLGTGVMAVDIDQNFDDLDKNSNGYIGVEETNENMTLSRFWYEFDADNDGRLDMAEFSAFEETSIDELEPYVLRHPWYGSIGDQNLGATSSY